MVEVLVIEVRVNVACLPFYVPVYPFGYWQL